MELRSQFVVFVSSSRKEEHLWRRLMPAFAEHPDLGARSQLAHFEGATSSARTISGRASNRQTAALQRFLRQRQFLAERPEWDPDLILVGFGSGCRLIQQYLVHT